MIIGFGFGDPLTSIIMLVLTSVLSFIIFRAFRRHKDFGTSLEDQRERMRNYYREQRETAREMMKEFDLTDEEIERRIDRKIGR